MKLKNLTCKENVLSELARKKEIMVTLLNFRLEAIVMPMFSEQFLVPCTMKIIILENIVPS